MKAPEADSTTQYKNAYAKWLATELPDIARRPRAPAPTGAQAAVDAACREALTKLGAPPENAHDKAVWSARLAEIYDTFGVIR